MACPILFSPEALDHLKAMLRRDQVAALDAIVDRLAHNATVETRNRKPMRPNPLAPWELRVGRLRVFYDATDEPEPVVEILAVGVKEGSRLRIGGEVVEL